MDNPSTDLPKPMRHGMTVWAEGTACEGGRPQIDIVAVQGLGAHPHHTWVAKEWLATELIPRRHWLRDFLPSDIPNARIASWGYNSTFRSNSPDVTLDVCGQDLLVALSHHRQKDKDMPLIFIGHSFGGIVIKKALVMGQLSRLKYPDFGKVLDSTRGVIFLGTPHDGAQIAGIGAWFVNKLRWIGLTWHDTLLCTLKYQSEELWKLGDDFGKIPSSIERVCFHETIEHTIYGINILIVTKQSASIQGVQSISLDCKHSQMNKFHSRENPNYVKVKQELLRIVAQRQMTEEERKEFLKWLSEIRYNDHHHTNSTDLLTNSGQWLLKDAEFQKWEKGGSVLWLRGIPGSGKTKLTSIVIDHSERNTENPRVVYFYCMRDSAQPERAQPVQILRAILKQLVLVLKEWPHNPVEEKYNQMKADAKGREEPPRVLDLNECKKLILALTSRHPITIIIDALDECDPTQRFELLEVIGRIMERPDNLTRIFISSRDDNDIVRCLKQYPNIVIEASKNTSDIRRFVVERVDEAIQKKILLDGDVTPQFRARIIKVLEEGARGMFRWVTLQIAALCDPDEMKIAEDVERRLGKLPRQLDELYAEIYERIKRTGETGLSIAITTLTWLLYAQRKLSSEALLAAVSPGRPVTSHDILKLCCNLVTLDQESNSFTFAHLSVREFLEKQKEYSPSEGHATIAKLCIELFQMDDDFVDDDSEDDDSEDEDSEDDDSEDEDAEDNDSQIKKLLPYASLYWPRHYQDAVDNDHHRVDRAFAAACTLLSNKSPNKGLLKWSDHGKKALESLRWTDNLRKRLDDASFEPLQTICTFGFAELLDNCLDQASSPNIIERSLILAIGWKNEQLARSLLEKVAGFGNVKIDLHLSFLWAVEHDMKSAMDAITNYESTLHIGGAAQWTLLHWMVLFRSTSGMRYLLEKGAGCDKQDKDRRTPLHFAAMNGYQDGVPLLLNKGAKSKIVDKVGWTPRHWAVCMEKIYGKNSLLDKEGDGNEGALMINLNNIENVLLRDDDLRLLDRRYQREIRETCDRITSSVTFKPPVMIPDTSEATPDD